MGVIEALLDPEPDPVWLTVTVVLGEGVVEALALLELVGEGDGVVELLTLGVGVNEALPEPEPVVDMVSL